MIEVTKETQLAVGDVVFVYNGFLGRLVQNEVTKVTKRWYTLKNGVRYNRSGREINGDQWHPTWLVQLSPEEWAELKMTRYVKSRKDLLLRLIKEAKLSVASGNS